MTKHTDVIEEIIIAAIDRAAPLIKEADRAETSSFEEVLSFGELVDRLSIVNLKLYNLKDSVAKKMKRKSLLKSGWAAEEDVRLVRERARLKRCIDEKLFILVGKVLHDGDFDYNPETKKYG